MFTMDLIITNNCLKNTCQYKILYVVHRLVENQKIAGQSTLNPLDSWTVVFQNGRPACYCLLSLFTIS